MTSLYRLLLVLRLIFVISVASAAKQGSKKYVGEVLVVFDSYAKAKYEGKNYVRDIFNEAEFFLTHANELFKTVKQYGLNFEIRIATIKLPDDQILIDANEDPTKPLNGLTSVHKFSRWQMSSNVKSDVDYDFAILYTGLPLDGINGIAFQGIVCKHRPSILPSIVIELNDFGTASTTAHEIAHILGAHHDGKASFNIMRQTKEPGRIERFSFSKCTAVDILQNLEGEGGDCLLKTTAAWTTDITPDKYKGQLQDAHYACRRRFGEGGRICDIPQEEDKKCLQVYCGSTTSTTCLGIPATEGMPCDRKKMCRMGQCVRDTLGYAKDTLPGCIFGDLENVKVLDKYVTCKEAHDFYGGALCVESIFKRKCCATCEKLKRKSNIPGCFGDSHNIKTPTGRINCATAIARLGARTACNTSEFYAPRCCEICDKIKGSSDCPYEEKGILWKGGEFTPCADVEEHYCLRESIADKCCQRCAGHRGKRSTEEMTTSTVAKH